MDSFYHIQGNLSRPCNLQLLRYYNYDEGDSICKLLNGDIPAGSVVLKFFATWCGPCQSLKPILEKVREAYPDVAFYEVDTDKHHELAEAFHVKSLPTTIFLKDNIEITRVIGCQRMSTYTNVLDDNK